MHKRIFFIVIFLVVFLCGWENGLAQPRMLYVISGRVVDTSHNALEGVFLSMGEGTVAVTNASGYYNINRIAVGQHILTPSKTGYTFNPTERSVVILSTGDDVNFQDFIATPNQAQVYSLSGQITDAQGNGVQNITLSLKGCCFVVSEANGLYRFENVPAGAYEILPSSLGYTYSPSLRRVIVSSYPISGQDFQAQANAPPTFEISGTVLDEAHIPLGSVSLRGLPSVSAVTAADGTYLLAGLTNGMHTIFPEKGGYAFTPLYRRVVIQSSALKEQDFLAKTVAVGNASVAGRVVNAIGEGVQDVLVYDFNGYITLTNAQGNYALKNLPTGNVYLTAYKSSYVFEPGFLQPLALSNVPVLGKNFIAQRAPENGNAVSGSIADNVGKPLVGVNIRDEFGHVTLTKADGSYLFSGLAADTYTFTPEKTGWLFAPLYRKVVIADEDVAKQYFVGTPVTLVPFTINGQVRDEGNQPLVNVLVYDNVGHKTTTDINGKYQLTDLYGAVFTLSAQKTGCTFTPIYRTVQLINKDIMGQDFSAKCTPLVTYTLRGMVKDGMGRGVGNVLISDLDEIYQTTTDAGGRYLLEGIPGGTYFFKAMSAAAQTINFPPNQLNVDFILR